MQAWHAAMKNGFVAVALLACVGLAGCMPTPRIGYGLDDVPPLSGGRFAGSVLVVDGFADARDGDALSRRRRKVGGAAVVLRDDVEWFANTDDSYPVTSVATAISQTIVEHLGRTQMFREVRLAPADGDLRLSGTVAQFDGYEERDGTARNLVAMGGLVALGVGAGRRVRYEAAAVLKDVTLVQSGTPEPLWKGDLDGRVVGDNLLMNSQEHAVFVNANVALKLAVNQLVDRLVAVDRAR